MLMQHNATFHRSIGHGVFNADDDEQCRCTLTRAACLGSARARRLRLCLRLLSGRAPGGSGRLSTPRGRGQSLGSQPLPRVLECAVS